MKIKKAKINPIHAEYKYMLSLRCGAKTRQQTSCLAPAVQNKKRCRMHGGAKGSGAPLNNKNALKHGNNTKEAKIHRKEISNIIKEWYEFQNKYGIEE
jgi:hypothetical protein